MFKKIITVSHLTFLKIYIELESGVDRKSYNLELGKEIDKVNYLNQMLVDKNYNGIEGVKVRWNWEQNQV